MKVMAELTSELTGETTSAPFRNRRKWLTAGPQDEFQWDRFRLNRVNPIAKAWCKIYRNLESKLNKYYYHLHLGNCAGVQYEGDLVDARSHQKSLQPGDILLLHVKRDSLRILRYWSSSLAILSPTLLVQPMLTGEYHVLLIITFSIMKWSIFASLKKEKSRRPSTGNVNQHRI